MDTTKKKVSDYNLNPRWVCWMISRGEDPGKFELAAPGEDCPRVVDPTDGKLLPRPLVFSFWIRARWAEWAAELGFTKSKDGWYPHELALFGRSHEDFDAWLRAKVGVEA